MHEIKWIRENPEAFDASLKKRGAAAQSAALIQLDESRREQLTALQNLQSERNGFAKNIAEAKRAGGNIEALMEASRQVNAKITSIEDSAAEQGRRLEEILAGIPNVLDESVPAGQDESANQEIKKEGAKPSLSFQPKEHFEIGEALGIMDFESAARMSGSRFVVLKDGLARMERALASFMLDNHTLEWGYREIVPPLLVRDHALFGTGQLPKFEEDLFKTTTDYYLIPTAEVPLTNLVADRILDDQKLPLRFTAYTPCFRSEAGSAGKDTRGMIRQHQFSKVELVSVVLPEQSNDEHERMLAAAESILKKLGLHYRVMLLCSGDTGFGAQKTYDIEVWLPGQGAYREISSCSNFGAFQARRMKTRFKRAGAKHTEFVHTLNGSGLAIGRTMIAILEHYQQADGSVAIPDALQKYMDGMKVIC